LEGTIEDIKNFYLVDCDSVGQDVVVPIHDKDFIVIYFTSNRNDLRITDFVREYVQIYPLAKFDMVSIINLELGRLLEKHGVKPNYYIVSCNKSFDIVSKYCAEGNFKVSRMEI